MIQNDATTADRTLSVSQIQRRLEELEPEAREEARKTRKSAYAGRTASFGTRTFTMSSGNRN